MKQALLVLVIASIACPQLMPLDSLVVRSETAKRQSNNQLGFIKLEPLPLIKSEAKSFDVSALRPLPIIPVADQYVTLHEYDKAMGQVQASISKVTTILENLQAQSDSHQKNLDFTVKLIEGLCALLGAISTLIATVYSIRKKNARSAYRKS